MLKYGLSLLILLLNVAGQAAGNTIDKKHFNFGHQLGYLYCRSDSAYFDAPGTWTFETGLMAYYTPEIPLVTNPAWQERLMLVAPLSFQVFASKAIALQIDLTDLFVEFPYHDIHQAGGKSPRFKTRMRLCGEGRVLPAMAFTVGVKFSSAKPFTIWENRHNYEESNGLAGACTGVADYLMLLTASKRLMPGLLTLHSRLGLAPLGSPVEYVRGSGQADEILYGLTAEMTPSSAPWRYTLGVDGMQHVIVDVDLADYAVARLEAGRYIKQTLLTLNLERGLTLSSDTWVAGFYIKWFFHRKNGASS